MMYGTKGNGAQFGLFARLNILSEQMNHLKLSNDKTTKTSYYKINSKCLILLSRIFLAPFRDLDDFVNLFVDFDNLR
jgi:hypothetical protein